jgi:glycine oxidase
LFCPGFNCISSRIRPLDHPGGLFSLGGAAISLFPALAGAPVVAHWAGLRPATPDKLPVLGPVPGWEGLLLATGHYRNGVLLAAVTGQAVAAWATGRAPAGNFAPFSPGRFQ